MAKRKPIIGIDLDDVCWDFLEAWIERHNEITEDDVVLDDIKGWDIGQYIKRGSKEMLFYILEQSDFWQTVQPKTDSSKYLKQLIEDGYEVYIVTTTSHKVLHNKMVRFLDLYPFMDDKQVITTSRKQLIDVDILVDDNPDNLRDGFYNKILFHAPHNRYINEKEIGAYRCYDWNEVYQKIRQLEPTEVEIKERWGSR